MKIIDAATLETIRQRGLKKLLPAVPKISVGMGTCGIGNGAREVYESLQNAIKTKKANIQLSITGCFGFCSEETLVNCYIPGMPLVILHKVTPKDAGTGRSTREEGALQDRALGFLYGEDRVRHRIAGGPKLE